MLLDISFLPCVTSMKPCFEIDTAIKMMKTKHMKADAAH